jgi:hypothetical protein
MGKPIAVVSLGLAFLGLEPRLATASRAGERMIGAAGAALIAGMAAVVRVLA